VVKGREKAPRDYGLPLAGDGGGCGSGSAKGGVKPVTVAVRGRCTEGRGIKKTRQFGDERKIRRKVALTKKNQ